MKTRISMLLALLLSVNSFISAQEVPFERLIVQLVDKVTGSYNADPGGTMKVNVAVADFTENDETAKSLQMGQAFRDVLISVLSRSRVFTVLDRTRLEALLEEAELQLSGITDESSAVKIGNLLNAEAMVFGSISAQGDNFLVSLKLVRVETGAVIAETVAVEKSLFTRVAEKRLDMLYVAPMGIGISLYGMQMTTTGNYPVINPFPGPDQTFFRRTAGVEVRYRIFDFLMAGVGISWLYGQLMYFPGGIGWSLPGPVTGSAPFTIYAKGFGLPFSLYGVFTPIRWLSLVAGFTAEYCLLEYEGLFNPSNGYGFGPNEIGPTYKSEFFLFTAQGGVEAFITPRLTFSLLAGFTYGTTALSFGNLSNVTGLPANMTLEVSGFTLTPRVTVYF
jgi:TolB-like protein